MFSWLWKSYNLHHPIACRCTQLQMRHRETDCVFPSWHITRFISGASFEKCRRGRDPDSLLPEEDASFFEAAALWRLHMYVYLSNSRCSATAVLERYCSRWFHHCARVTGIVVLPVRLAPSLTRPRRGSNSGPTSMTTASINTALASEATNKCFT